MIMIPAYSDHAADERTFLAWVRTGIAIMSFGILVEKFDLFIRTLAISETTDVLRRAQLDRISSHLGPHESIALIAAGVALIAIQTLRFARNSHLLGDTERHALRAARTGSVVSALLILLVAAVATYQVFD
ncbi:YidH family protein [Bradyrhizobium sp. HKCCYLRH2015]|uniref:YidH family protein n=1 Tax=Bradyrhizobium sp. HKCCYLRH2015 TaxID=3420742 RepID=UPI003EBAD178